MAAQFSPRRRRRLTGYGSWWVAILWVGRGPFTRVGEGVSLLISTGLERLEWNETIRRRSFHSKLFVSILNFQATEQPTRTENNPTDLCGGTAQLDPTTGHVGSECS